MLAMLSGSKLMGIATLPTLHPLRTRVFYPRPAAARFTECGSLGQSASGRLGAIRVEANQDGRLRGSPLRFGPGRMHLRRSSCGKSSSSPNFPGKQARDDTGAHITRRPRLGRRQGLAYGCLPCELSQSWAHLAAIDSWLCDGQRVQFVGGRRSQPLGSSRRAFPPVRVFESPTPAARTRPNQQEFPWKAESTSVSVSFFWRAIPGISLSPCFITRSIAGRHSAWQADRDRRTSGK